MYKTAEGKGENKYGLDGSAARSKYLPWQWCLARLLRLLGARLAAPGSSAHPLPRMLELAASNVGDSTGFDDPVRAVESLYSLYSLYLLHPLYSLFYRPRRGRGARAQGGGAHAHLLGEHDGEGRQGHCRRRLRL